MLKKQISKLHSENELKDAHNEDQTHKIPLTLTPVKLSLRWAWKKHSTLRDDWIRISDDNEAANCMKYLGQVMLRNGERRANKLKIRFRTLNNDGVKTIVSGITAYFTHLTELNLNFNYCMKLRDNSIQEIAQKIPLYGTQLQRLSLNFNCCTQITEIGVEIIAKEILKYLTSLKHLDLRFSWNITDKGLEMLGSSISRYLIWLQHLTLHFIKCNAMTDQGLIMLGQCVPKYLMGLKHLSLVFSSQNISNKGVESLGLDIVRSRSRLQSFNFDFQECKSVTEKGIKPVALEISKKQMQLDTLSLGFFCLPASLDEIRDILNFIPNLYLPEL